MMMTISGEIYRGRGGRLLDLITVHYVISGRRSRFSAFQGITQNLRWQMIDHSFPGKSKASQGNPKQVAALGKSAGKPGEPIILWTISPTESQRCVWTCGATDGASVGAITSHQCCQSHNCSPGRHGTAAKTQCRPVIATN